MYEYEEEPMFEPMPEFLEKIQEIVGEAVVTGREEMLKELGEEKSKNSKLRTENHELSVKVRNMAHEIKKQVDEARKEFEREMFGGFMRGDPMFYAGFEYEFTPCETCQGLGMLPATLGDGKEVKVKCVGEKCESGKIKKGVYVVRETKVKHLSLYGDEYGKKDIRVYYKRLDSRGESDLGHVDCYKTAEEAQKVCDALTIKYRKEKAEQEERERRNKK